MAFADRGIAVGECRACSGHEFRWLRAEPHCAPFVGDVLLLVEQADHRMRRVAAEFGGVRALQTKDIAAVFDHSALHAQTDAKERDIPLASVADRIDLALDAAFAEPAGDEDRVEAASKRSGPSTSIFSLRMLTTRMLALCWMPAWSIDS